MSFRQWYWRIAAALFAGFVFDRIYSHMWAGMILEKISGLLGGGGQAFQTDLQWALAIAVVDLPVAVLTLLVYGLLTRWAAIKGDSETRCRNCQYILKGISEPRCPECGERI